jgi:hypothetical protein
VKRAIVALGGATLTACVLAWAQTGDQTTRVAHHIALYGVAFAAYLASLWAAPELSRRGLLAAMVAAGVWRTALVACPPLLSDDVNRLVWEGRVQLHGGNPYAWGDRPESPRWAALRDDVWRGLNHRDYTAIYPPAWQLGARLAVAVSDSVVGMKAFLALCELACLVPLSLVLRRRGLPQWRLLVLAWSPLCLVETAGSGHNEAFGMLFVCLSLLALEAKRPFLSALAAAVGAQAKFLPGLLAVAWARRYRPGHVLAALLAGAALAWPYLDAGKDFYLSLVRYSQSWRFNDTLFAVLVAALGTHDAAVRVASVVVLALAGALAVRNVEPVAGALAVAVASLLFAPNLLPWYALWLVPLLVVRDEPFALLFTGTVGLAYLVYPAWQSGERWAVGWDVRALEYVPCVVVAAATWWRRRGQRARERLLVSGLH